MDNGVKYDKDVDYMFVVNIDGFSLKSEVDSKTNPSFFSPSEKFGNALEGVSAKLMMRDNVGRDFGGYSCVVDRLVSNGLINEYDYFVFLNQTVTGPLFPRWYDNKRHWSNLFTDLINEKDKLIGATINCYGRMKGDQPKDPRIGSHLIWDNYKEPTMDDTHPWAPHVQSFCFAMDRTAIEIAIDNNIFDYNNIVDDYPSIVVEKEMRLSEVMLSNGYNIASLLDCSYGIDFRGVNHGKEARERGWQPWNDIYCHAYFDEKCHPYETVFVKSNRSTNAPGVRSPFHTARFMKWKKNQKEKRKL
ncbi:hypothetical protein CMI37_13010 [Candidatus Pacearchaeota archaeon]|nr:hypothetical protein [Candidatus Pacearchaeota archaeon]